MRIPTYLITALFVWISVLAMAQDAPILRCISLDDNDDVTLYWEQPSDTGSEFNAYLIYYRSGSTSNFNLLSQVTDYNQTSELINGSFAGAGSFFVVQLYNGGADTSQATDTISPMVVGISSKGKRVSLGWNHTGLRSQDSLYRVYRWQAGAWQLFRTLEYPQTAVRDTVYSCEQTVLYKVETKGVGGCISRSNDASKVVIDMEPPQRVNLECASVDTATGFVNLEWNASRSEDTYGYMLFYFEDFNRTDTSYGAGTLEWTYTENNINGLIQPETLSVAPFDSCFDSTNMWYNQAADSLRFVTMFIDTVDFDRCPGKLAIKWSHPAEPFVLGVRNLGGFHVYRRTDNGPSQRIAVLSASDSIFVDSGLVAGFKYTYVVTAVDGNTGKEALSNKLNFSMKAKNEPDYLYIKSIKNDHSSGLNEVHILADSTAETFEYGLFRALSYDGRYVLVNRIDAEEVSQFFILDEDGEADRLSYHYQVAAFDVCGDIIGRSQEVQSVHISGTKNVRDLINTLEWNEYEGFDSLGNGLLEYELVREAGWRDILASYEKPAKHKDDIAYLEDVQGNVCYFVRAVEDGENSYGIQDSSISNLLCLEFPALAFIPNAFTPDGDGYNDEFLPYVNFIDHADYTLIIFDRMGNRVFETSDPNEGWNGQGSANGTYAYHITLMNVLGERVERTGKVHLIR